jgi:thiol-disulfide isomerase/thioredoxin
MYLSQKQFIPLVIVIAVVAGFSYWLGGMDSNSPDSSESASSTTDSVVAASSSGAVIEDWTALPKKPTDRTGAEVSTTPTPFSGKLAPEFVRPGGFTNTDPFLLKDLRGKKIVLVEFWTTSSINSVRTIPYLNDWYAKYHNYGLTIVAIHTPRFTFERSKTIVDQFAYSHNMPYPIVIDNGAETWTAYKNATWPHLYLIDLDGRIAYDHSGEGSYEATEKKLLSLLNDRAAKLKLPAPLDQKISKLTVDTADLSQLGSSEAFFGSARNKNLANGTTGKDGIQTFDTLSDPKLNMEYLFGGWKITRDYAENLTEHTSAIYRFHAKQVYTIMGSQKLIRVKVLLDGKPLDATNSGKDIRIEKGESVFYVDRERFYDIVDIDAGYGDHTIELTPEAGGLDIYTLTFG